jgi:hypothetical protein
MTATEFWKVGDADPTWLDFTSQDVSSRLAEDWLPSLPPDVSRALIGWPDFLLESIAYKGRDCLALRQLAGRTERQWRVFLSWMVGVAGARHFLKEDGYQWVAPVSAFYQSSKVDPGKWPGQYHQEKLRAHRRPKSRAKLRPDLLAVRPLDGGGYELASVEVKGVRSLGPKPSALQRWQRQSKNIYLEYDGQPVLIARYIVVATRVNPSGEDKTRRLQVRTWNHAVTHAESHAGNLAALEIATAHLYGLCRNVWLPASARALADAPWRTVDAVAESMIPNVNRELERHQGESGLAVSLNRTERGTPTARIDPAVVDLIRALVSAQTPHAGLQALAVATSRLAGQSTSPNESGVLGRRAPRPTVVVTQPEEITSDE